MVIIFVILLLSVWFVIDFNEKTKTAGGTDWEYLRLLKKLDKIDIWDGVEQQIFHKMNERGISHDKIYVKYFVRFGSETGKLLDINLNTVNINRQYWVSGLSANDFAKKYYSECGIMTSPEKYKSAQSDIYLYAKDGSYQVFSKYFVLHELEDDVKAEYEKIIDSMLRKTPHKAFNKLVDDKCVNHQELKYHIERIRLLKNGYYPYPIYKKEHGNRVSEYLTFNALRQEVSSEYSIYEIDNIKWDTKKIDEAEESAKERNLSKDKKYVRGKIKDYLWKNYHEQIVAAGAEESFQRWNYKF